MHKHAVLCFVLQLAICLSRVLCKIDSGADSPPKPQITSVQSIGNFEDDYSESNEKDDNCIRLPPNAKRSKVSHENDVSFTSLLSGGFDNMVNADTHKDVILILGNTGVGKTVVTQMIAGNLSKIHAVYTHTGNLVIIDEAERISAPSVISRTLVPELVIKIGNEYCIAFYDCPGFDDTRGPAQDVATSFFMNQIVKKVKRVKILFLVLYSSVQLGHDRLDFDLMVQHATNFVKNVTMFEDSIGLVVTKVKNYGSNGEYLKDKTIKRKIIEFLFGYRETLHYSLKKEDDKEKTRKLTEKIEFVNILLQKDSNGQFSKITFSRDPEKCGPLSQSTEVANTKKRIEKLYESLHFNDVGNSSANFGFTLKSETTLKIATDYVPELNDGIVKQVANLTENFKIWFDIKRHSDVGNYSTSLAANLNTEVEKISTDIMNMLSLGNSSSIGAADFALTVENGFTQLGYSVPQEFTNFSEKQEIMFEFFENVVGSEKAERRINDWLSPVSSLQGKMLDLKSWYDFCAKLQDEVISYEFQSKNISESNTSWIEFIETNRVISLSPNIKFLENTFGQNSTEVQLLNDIMSYATVPADFKCFDKGFSITNNFVRFGEFVDKNGFLSPWLYMVCGFNNATKQIVITVYASNRVFFDENVNAVGLELNLVVVAPKCEIIGRPHINLDGKAAKNHDSLKALDGYENWAMSGSPGEHGLAGKAGGPGGSFYGVFSNIKGGDKLTISANGGNGSDGQNGGNGGKGGDGRNANSHDTVSYHWIVGVFYNKVSRRHGGFDGYVGGRGGDGGVGGPGGNPGAIEVKLLEETVSFNVSEQVSNRLGYVGKYGDGGKGGEGGKKGNGMDCYEHWGLFIRGRDECYTFNNNDWANPGHSGMQNNSQKGFENAEVIFYGINITESITKFKDLFSMSLDYDARKFVENLADKATD